jgi:hypothetical protein
MNPVSPEAAAKISKQPNTIANAGLDAPRVQQRSEKASGSAENPKIQKNCFIESLA